MTAAPDPVVSVVVATLNEEHAIAGFLTSVLGQDLDEPFEILVVDGGSTDRTRDEVAAIADRDPRVRFLENPDRFTPYAFNIGVREARGEFVAILGAHCRYDRNYLSASLRGLRAAGGRAACGGLVNTVPADDSLDAGVAAAVMGSSFASSPNSFRTQGAGEVDSIAYPLYRRDDVLEVGGFDERLTRNQDNDLSERLRRAGVHMYVTDETSCDYLARPGVAALCKYAYRTGDWNGRTVRMGLDVLKVRHFVPAALVGALVVGSVGSIGSGWRARAARGLMVGTLATHQALAAAAARSTDGPPALVAPATLGFHLAYGAGTIAGLLRG